MVIFRRQPSRAAVLRAATYGVVIATLGALVLWAYIRHGRAAGPVLPPPRAERDRPAAAGLEPRTALALDQELFAPGCFPWSLGAVTRLPRAEVTKTRLTRGPADKGAAAELQRTLADELARQAPTLARPFALPASPPYLVTPLTVELECELDEEGAATLAAVGGAPPDLNAALAEEATTLVFPREAAGAAFTATVTLVPYPYDRIRARRGGAPLAADDFRLLFRTLQFSSYPLYDAVRGAAPELLTAPEDTRLSFTVGADGHPGRVDFTPPPPAAAELAAAVEGMMFPRGLVGVRAEVSVGGGSPPAAPAL